MVNHQYPKGHILVFTSGDYSDYQICCTLVASKDLNLVELVEQYKTDFKPVATYHPERQYWIIDHENPSGPKILKTMKAWTDWSKPTQDGFIAWLTTEGWVEASDNVSEIYVGSYGELRLN